MTTARWDFEYLPLRARSGPLEPENDFVVATDTSESTDRLSHLLVRFGAEVEPLLDRAPLHWYRVRLAEAADAHDVVAALETELGVRYATSSLHARLALAPRLDAATFPVATARDWALRQARAHVAPPGPGHWFLDALGADVDRSVCGTGAGARLAVVDDEARETDALELDAEIPIGVTHAPRGSSHGSTMVAWASGSRGRPEAGLAPFVGVAPDASTRLYVIPKPGRELFWLPLALVRAVDDGADVVVCATYVEGTTSPLLDDALEFAACAGRGGKGAVVVLPTGREVSSAPGSVHASLTLGFADPASDPRVLCVAPSGRDGGWFFWPDKRGLQRPFANRGPAVRIASPGDDMAYPFAIDGRLGHAESSGASAVAAGVATLLVAKCPALDARAAVALLARTAVRDPATVPERLADPFDTLPAGRDHDGHDAKTGYGRVSARRACLAATDPVCAALLDMGEDGAATRYHALRNGDRRCGDAYTDALAEWTSRWLAAAPGSLHACSAVLRHLRLLSGRPERARLSPDGAVCRALSLVLRDATKAAPPGPVREELARLETEASRAIRDGGTGNLLESRILALCPSVFGTAARDPLPVRRSSVPPPSVGALKRSA